MGKAGLENLCDDVFPEALVLDVHHGIVALRIEGLARFAEGLDTQRVEDLDKLCQGHLHALFIGLVCGLVMQGPLEVIIDGKELLHRIGNGILIDAVLFALRALAEGADARNPLILLGETLRQADECAAKNAENSLTDAPTREIHYINMRRQQRRILLQVTQDAQKVQGHPPQEAEVRALIGRIFAEYDRENDCTSLLSALHDLLSEMEHQPLPVTRGEFEDRALLYVLLRRMEDFLLLKREFYETYGYEINHQ